jgi:hypothetical protein
MGVMDPHGCSDRKQEERRESGGPNATGTLLLVF